MQDVLIRCVGELRGSRVGGESWVSDTNPEGRERMLYNEIQRTLGGGGRSVG